jgi:hypothetical protein
MVIIRREDRIVRERGLPFVVCRDDDGDGDGDGRMGGGYSWEWEQKRREAQEAEAELTAKEELARFA